MFEVGKTYWAVEEKKPVVCLAVRKAGSYRALFAHADNKEEWLQTDEKGNGLFGRLVTEAAPVEPRTVDIHMFGLWGEKNYLGVISSLDRDYIEGQKRGYMAQGCGVSCIKTIVFTEE